MVKFKWPSDRVPLQRIVIISVIGMISCGILNGYISYYRQVSEYLQSMAYRHAQESTKDYQVTLMKRNQQLFSSDGLGASLKNDD